MKYAMTLDGKIAAYTGASKWVTGEEARAYVQQERHRYRGIMVGVGTVLADDPMLNCRMPGGRNGADYLRHAFADTAHIPDCKNGKGDFDHPWPSVRQTVPGISPMKKRDAASSRFPRQTGMWI